MASDTTCDPPTAVTVSWWLQDLCPGGYKTMVPAAVSLSPLLLAKPESHLGIDFCQVVLISPLLHENTDVSNMWL